MRKQTEKMQKEWVKNHLNDGVLPAEDSAFWWDYAADSQACYQALAWLDAATPNISSLEEAWDRVPRLDWLIWALSKLPTSQAEDKKVYLLLNKLCEEFFFIPSHRRFFMFDKETIEEYRDTLRGTKRFLSSAYWADRGLFWENLWTYSFDLLTCKGHKEDMNLWSKRYKELNRQAADMFRAEFPNPWRSK